METQPAEGQVFNIGDATTEMTIADLARKVIEGEQQQLHDRSRERTSSTFGAGFRGHCAARAVGGSRRRAAWLDRACRPR